MTAQKEATQTGTTLKGKKSFSDVAGSTAARALVMPISAAAVLFSSSLVTQERGVEGFALFSIFVALPYMVPISDFGISVSITDTLATKGVDSPEFRFVWRRTLLILCLIAVLTITVAILLALGGYWSPILGLPASVDTELAGVTMMIIMALGIPLGVGQRVLLGLGKQTLSTLLTSSSGCISLVFVWLCISLEPTGYAALSAAYGAGPLLMQLVVFMMAVKTARQGRSRNGTRPEQARVKVMQLALPMAILTIALPLTYQTDRVLLAHSADLLQVADYSYVSMYYMPLLSIITVGSQALWPLFLKLANNPRRLKRQYRKADKLFFSLATLMMIGLICVGPAATQIVSGGQGSPPMILYIVFGLMLVAFGLNASSGMLLMDHQGRKIQALGAVALVSVKIPLSLMLIPLLGATGAVLATFCPLIVCMIVPTRIVALIRIKKGVVIS